MSPGVERQTSAEPQDWEAGEWEAGRLCAPARYGLIGLGVVCTGLGIAGILLPVMPGTVFLLIAAWAFSRSSERLHLWLYHHPRFGGTIRDWHRYRAIPRRAKVMAIAMMTVSAVYVSLVAEAGSLVPLMVVLAILPVATWIATRPSRLPETT